jgi:hypothetical protein
MTLVLEFWLRARNKTAGHEFQKVLLTSFAVDTPFPCHAIPVAFSTLEAWFVMRAILSVDVVKHN